MHCQMFVRHNFATTNQNYRMWILLWKLCSPNATNWPAMFVAAAVIFSGFAETDSCALGQEQSGVSIALTLTPTVPQKTSEVAPTESHDIVVKPPMGKTEAIGSKQPDKGVTTAAGTAAGAAELNSLALNAFENSQSQSKATTAAESQDVTAESDKCKPTVDQLMLTESGSTPATAKLETKKSVEITSQDAKSEGGAELDSQQAEMPPSPSKKPTGAVGTKTTDKHTPTNEVKTSATGAKSQAPATENVPTSPTKTSRKRAEFDNEDAGVDEVAGGSVASEQTLPSTDDVPLEQEEHPYDAPAADSTSSTPDRPAVKAQAEFTLQQLRLRDDINRCLGYFMDRPETIARRSPWAVMHAILPFGVEAELGAGNRRVNAIGWMCYNGVCKTQRIFQPTRAGFRTNLGPGVQGHEGQFLAILAQSKVAPTYPIKIGNRSYTINDLVRLEMATCREKSELTFKLIGLSHYVDHNQRWRDNQGGNWSIEKLVAEELDQPVVGAACGGTHRLMGLTYSLLKHKQAGLPVTGHWYRAEEYLNDFVAYAFSLQNSDGSFGTEWFERRANEPNIERKVQTTGHTLEWLVYTLPDDQLGSPQILKSIEFLLGTIGAEPGRDWPIGPRGHSLRALALYNQRVFGAQPGKMRQFIANSKTESNLR